VGAERWLLYQLVHVLASHEKQPAALRQVDLHPARLFLRYYRDVLLADLRPGAAGPLCAIDLDGVLETMPLGFPATSPAGALALRALNRHGYRPVLATGRSLDKVRDRCAAYSLPGGVAEYGSLVYLHGNGDVRSLQEPAEREALDRLRATLAEARDVHIDPAFQHSVRAFRLDARGRRRGLPAERVAEALGATADGMLRPVPGHYQPDYVATGTGKERGLRVLARELGVGGETPLALAVGDTASDLEVLRLAQMRIAPGNADQAARGASVVTVVRAPTQVGLARRWPGSSATDREGARYARRLRSSAPVGFCWTCCRWRTSAAGGAWFGPRGSCWHHEEAASGIAADGLPQRSYGRTPGNRPSPPPPIGLIPRQRDLI